ncbi:cupin domain-containing protein [Pseudoalteromonas sp. SG45-5]|uniref:ChrR family anti-sigma-E factor n=1 Tax=unclassified Pseudoalteromonas TaxID=194690 RepID=UPI0015F7A053|nr:MULTISPECIES: ChrR family anti-sigma-E factor [unclassified Pseudoalteromonas]MBB1384969.1 cupin domain-containing protein [Pseudoalteromonas sp. SG45-5]MBB1392883.1 cupin domain-containing protein [Pseudoalteromonas sp. SG44-4]MBB1446152.1 cupin domain-containing protein [Pseudoalteromonas sp. SG41-6]
MIKHHPSETLLTEYCSASLSASLSLAVSIHVDMCPVCQAKVAKIEASNANELFSEQPTQFEKSHIEQSGSFEEFELNLLDMITSDNSIDEVYEVAPVSIKVNEHKYQLPRALTRISHSKFTQVGKLARSRVALDDGALRSSLLHIDAGGEIPEHTHTGFEVTLLLDGEFSDEEDSYVPGDFIWQDGSHQHTPLTKDGCLCFTVVSSALHFNKGFSKLLNPIGNLIY